MYKQQCVPKEPKGSTDERMLKEGYLMNSITTKLNLKGFLSVLNILPFLKLNLSHTHNTNLLCIYCLPNPFLLMLTYQLYSACVCIANPRYFF